MRIPIDEVVHFDVITANVSTGAVSDADSGPTYDVFEEATDTPILDDQTLTKRTSLTGNYRGTFTASAANGFEAGKWYIVVASATVNSVAGKTVAMQFQCVPAESAAGVAKVDPSHIGGNSEAATRLARGARGIVTGTCDAGSSTTSVIASATSPASGVNDQFNGRIIIFDEATTTAALRGQATDITDYVHATKTFTVTALTTAPASGDTFTIT